MIREINTKTGKETTRKPTELEQTVWDSGKARELDDAPLREIHRLESQVTQRRLREAYADSTWLDAQEALIATERAKLKE